MIDPETRRELDALKQGTTYTGGSFTLNVSSTSTIVSRRGISSGSVVHSMPTGSTAAFSDIVRIVPAKDTFFVTHTSSTASTRTFTYTFATPTG